MKFVVGTAGFAAAFYTNVAVTLIVVGAVLGTVAFVVWVRNRANLRQLDEFLRSQAVAGTAALADREPKRDGA